MEQKNAKLLPGGGFRIRISIRLNPGGLSRYEDRDP